MRKIWTILKGKLKHNIKFKNKGAQKDHFLLNIFKLANLLLEQKSLFFGNMFKEIWINSEKKISFFAQIF